VLIYDHNKTFIGIDEESLALLGYDQFEELIHDHKDVAELFVKKPGYIHNFTNFPWIDFVLHAEADDAKVIIAGKSKSFSAKISISVLHLTQAPSETAYMVKLQNIQSYQLDASEEPEKVSVAFASEVQKVRETAVKPEPIVQEEAQDVFEQPPITFDDDIFLTEEAEEAVPVAEEVASVPPVSQEEDNLEIFFGDEEPDEERPVDDDINFPKPEESIFDNVKEEEDATPMLGASLTESEKAYLADLEFDDNYVYNPQIAADELGLPVDLIEEFIGDFINQAHEFKEQLFDAMEKEDFDNIKVLSHKLKGVAANLRIEDSFEVLRNINETDDIKECEANLKKFYLTVAKLEGKDIEEVKRELERPITDLYDLELKEPIVPEIAQQETTDIPLEMPGFKEEFYQETIPAEEETYPSPELEPLFDSEPELPVFEDEPLLPPLETKIPELEEEPVYDYGLAQSEDNDAPLMILDDEEEIMSEIEEIPDESEILSELEDFEEPENDTLIDQAALTFDVNTASAEIGLSADLVGALIDDYIVEANDMKSKLTEVIEASDTIRWKGYATQLKGVSDNLRITDISDTLQKLIASTDETQAKAAMQEFYGFINQL